MRGSALSARCWNCKSEATKGICRFSPHSWPTLNEVPPNPGITVRRIRPHRVCIQVNSFQFFRQGLINILELSAVFFVARFWKLFLPREIWAPSAQPDCKTFRPQFVGQLITSMLCCYCLFPLIAFFPVAHDPNLIAFLLAFFWSWTGIWVYSINNNINRELANCFNCFVNPLHVRSSLRDMAPGLSELSGPCNITPPSALFVPNSARFTMERKNYQSPVPPAPKASTSDMAILKLGHLLKYCSHIPQHSL